MPDNTNRVSLTPEEQKAHKQASTERYNLRLTAQENHNAVMQSELTRLTKQYDLRFVYCRRKEVDYLTGHVGTACRGGVTIAFSQDEGDKFAYYTAVWCSKDEVFWKLFGCHAAAVAYSYAFRSEQIQPLDVTYSKGMRTDQILKRMFDAAVNPPMEGVIYAQLDAVATALKTQSDLLSLWAHDLMKLPAFAKRHK